MVEHTSTFGALPIPDQLQGVADTMHQLGFDEPVDELEVGMNRAAERASAKAREVFWDAATPNTSYRIGESP